MTQSGPEFSVEQLMGGRRDGDVTIHGEYIGSTELAPPGPPALPRCDECGRVNGEIAMRGHLPGCTIGAERRRRSAVVADVRAAIAQAISERRTDAEFMDRLHARIEADGVILDRLVEP